MVDPSTLPATAFHKFATPMSRAGRERQRDPGGRSRLSLPLQPGYRVDNVLKSLGTEPA
jgi:hypothetical protein